MARLAGPVTGASAGAVAARTGLRVEFDAAGDRVGGLRDRRRRRGGAPAPARRPGRDADRLRGPGRARRPRLHAARHHHDPARPGRPGRGRRALELAVAEDEFPGGLGHQPRQLERPRGGDRQRVRHRAPRPEDEARDRPELRLGHGELRDQQRPRRDHQHGLPRPPRRGHRRRGDGQRRGRAGRLLRLRGDPVQDRLRRPAANVDDKFVRDLTEALVAAGNSDAAVINMSLGTSRDHAAVRAAVNYARPTRQGRRGLGRQLAARRAGPRGRAELPGRLPGRHRGGLHAPRRQHLARLDQRRLRGHRRPGQPDPLDLGLTPRRERRGPSSPRPTASATRCSPGPRWRRRSWPASRR